jgi:hypothetical protein
LKRLRMNIRSRCREKSTENYREDEEAFHFYSL